MKKQDINWGQLSFGYLRTNYNVRCYYRNGKWGKVEFTSSEDISIHSAATALHYGQEAFEGLKAFEGKDGKVRLFRWEENWKRINASARGIMMQEIPQEIFEEALFKVINLNRDFIPPYGHGASLYIRPLLLGTGAQIGVKPASEYLFLILVTPVGPYFKTGFKPVDIMITREYDRAAPRGTGNIKVGGNYAASLVALDKGHKAGFASTMFVDSVQQRFIDEAGPANFFGIKENKYITPRSNSILPSITNKSLRTLASDMGLEVEERLIPVEELATFEEAGACGTAAVISPIGKIVDGSNTYSYGDEAGKWSKKLYDKLVGIQLGEEEDVHGWITLVE